MNMRHYTYQILVNLLLLTSTIMPQDFIFDFGGVLILTDMMQSFKNIGLIDVTSCSIQLGINPLYLDKYIKARLFEIMDKVATTDTIPMAYPCHITYDEKGNKLPLLMCAWLQGAVNSANAQSLLEDEMNLHHEWFRCDAEKRIICNTIRLIFTPELFVSSRKMSPACIAFIKKCKREGHRVYGLSNWDAESFELLKLKHAELFSLFDGIVISAHVNANKPHETIYHALLNRYQLIAENCWFIDDQLENIEAAQKLGINAIQHTSTFKNLIKKIKLAHSKSVTRRENLNNNGTSDTPINNSNIAIIEGEKISLTDSTKYNCLPANA
jgi:FMN phosphatase YigB (HAD superfamily)